MSFDDAIPADEDAVENSDELEDAPEATEAGPPQFIYDAGVVAEAMRVILEAEFVRENTGDAAVWATITEQKISAGQVLLNASQAIEMWRQQQQQLDQQERALAMAMAREQQGGGGRGMILQPIPPGLH